MIPHRVVAPSRICAQTIVCPHIWCLPIFDNRPVIQVDPSVPLDDVHVGSRINMMFIPGVIIVPIGAPSITLFGVIVKFDLYISLDSYYYD